MSERLALVLVFSLAAIAPARAQESPPVLVVVASDAALPARRVEAELGARGLVSERVDDDGAPLATLSERHGRRAVLRVRLATIEVWLADAAGEVLLDETMPAGEGDPTAPLRAVERLRAAAWQPAPEAVPEPVPATLPETVTVPPPACAPPAPAVDRARLAMAGVARIAEGMDALAHVAIDASACVDVAAPCDLTLGLAGLAPTMPWIARIPEGVVSLELATLAASVAYWIDLRPVRLAPRLTLGAIVYVVDAVPVAPFRASEDVRVGFDATLGLAAAVALADAVALRLDVDAEVALPILDVLAADRSIARVGAWGGRAALGIEVSVR